MQEAHHCAGDAGVVEHDVQAAEVRDREVDERLHLIGVAHVGLMECGRVAELPGQRIARLAIDVGDHHAGTFGNEPLDARAADTAGTARDHRDLAGQFVSHRPVPPCRVRCTAPRQPAQGQRSVPLTNGTTPK